MKLAHYQIEHIKDYINDQDIWYKEIKEEILDHIVSAVEIQMTESSNDFLETLAQVLTEIDILSIQKAKASLESKTTLRLIGIEMLTYLKGKRLAMILLMFIGILLISITTTFFSFHLVEGLTILAIIPFISLYSYFKSPALLHTIFKLRIKVIMWVPIMFITFNNLLSLIDYSSDILTALSYCGFGWIIIASFKVLKTTYRRIKLHGAI